MELRQLRCLDLSYNLISDMSLLAESIVQGKLYRLERVYLHNNRIAFVPFRFAAQLGSDGDNDEARAKGKSKQLSALRLLSLEHNPLLVVDAATEAAAGEASAISLATLRAICSQLIAQRGLAGSSTGGRDSDELRQRQLINEGRSASECSVCGQLYVDASVAVVPRRCEGSLLGQPSCVFTIGGDACSVSCEQLLRTQLAADPAGRPSQPADAAGADADHHCGNAGAM
jgi:hypothetical protein